MNTCRAKTRSSTVPLTTSFTTLTGRLWPTRCTRSMACGEQINHDGEQNVEWNSDVICTELMLRTSTSLMGQALFLLIIITWSSTAAFHQGSAKMTLFAAARLRPTCVTEEYIKWETAFRPTVGPEPQAIDHEPWFSNWSAYTGSRKLYKKPFARNLQCIYAGAIQRNSNKMIVLPLTISSQHSITSSIVLCTIKNSGWQSRRKVE